uniref:Lipoprotein n=1 Tax=Ignavibacterium album TaxID=591197 RepID=A0A832CYJ7_9BACT
MKKLIILAAFSTLALQGCYTVILTPEDKYVRSGEYYGYYPIEYYGDYGNYYDLPWWHSTPVVTVCSTQPIKRNEDTQSLRNNSGNRNETEKRDWIISTPPPSRDNSSGSSTENSSTSSGNNTQVRSGSNSGSNSNNSNSGSVRNENGNRNSGNSRR